jgi:ATP/maltotriose-dependent transcriptional regulator MalT/DNA-binding SARP family transcriptional activator
MLILRTKLTPPHLPQRTLERPRLTARLAEALDHRLTIVHAEAGYGKSTALVLLAASGQPTAWLHLDAEDAEPLLFMHGLLASLRLALPGLTDAPDVLLEGWSGASGEARWAATVDALVNELDAHLAQPLLLVLDDAHHIARAPQILEALNRLLDRAPYALHTVLATRLPVPLPSLPAWRLRGEVLEIDRSDLAFTRAEITDLFAQHYGVTLTEAQVARLAEQTEGWAIALPLAWQSSAHDAANSAVRRRTAARPDDLFSYLAHEVLAQQPRPVVEFLRQTAVLRELSPHVCDCLVGRNAFNPSSSRIHDPVASAARRITDPPGAGEANSNASSSSRIHDPAVSTAGRITDPPGVGEEILRGLLESGLFVVSLGEGHARYHHLFQQFLLHQLTPPEAQAAHRQAAACYLAQGQPEEALHHLLAAHAWDEAAQALRSLGQELVRAGRLDTLASWIHALPPDVLERHPPLLAYLGDVARLHSRFNEALGWYQQAETHSRAQGDLQSAGQALRGQARVYLDTVNPSQAEHLLQEALRLSDGQEDRETRIRLLELLAENRLNLGRLEDAERFQSQAAALREEVSSEAELAVRVLVRTGRLSEARLILEERAEAERRAPVLRPRAHRETSLLLSLLLAFQGDGEAALRTAVEGTERGQALSSPFITAVGFMRQGHAWQLQPAADAAEQAIRCFRNAIAIAEDLAVPRLKVEAFWGLCRAYGFAGNLSAAEAAAAQGMAIAQQTGDEWVTALIRLAMAGSYVLAGRHDDAGPLLAEAAAAFRECSDTFGETAARLWQCLLWQATGDAARLERGVEELLRPARDHGYDWLFLRPTLLGPPDPRRIVPLLLRARAAERFRSYAANLLGRLGLARLELHPGYQLRVQTLGPFEIWRGAEAVAAHEWRRDKARQLFQLLLTRRKRLLERDQIVELLWPGLDAETAERDFKVALSTLYRVLEPALPPRAPSAYVLREGTLYGLRPGADLWLDAEQFERLAAEGDRLATNGDEAFIERYRAALALYGGDFLQDYLYDEWCSEERERRLGVWLHTADRLAAALAERGRWQEVIDMGQAILRRDECWEQAYRLLMLAHARLGNRAQALRTYQRCVERLRAELDVPPSAATVGLFEELRGM